jgi:hypothetical protein
MNLVLEPGLNATWERFGLFCIGDPKIPSNDRPNLIRSPGPSQFSDALKNRPDVLQSCLCFFVSLRSRREQRPAAVDLATQELDTLFGRNLWWSLFGRDR